MTDRASTSPATFLAWVFQDWKSNRTYPDSQLILLWFRFSQWAYAHWGHAGWILAIAYRLLTSLFLSIELPHQVQVGPRLRLFHPHSIVLNPGVRLGADCVLRQNVTIGNVVRRDGTERGVASAGDGVEFGAGCVVIGNIHVGDYARIGALALVVDDIPAYGVVVANTAQVLRVDNPTANDGN